MQRTGPSTPPPREKIVGDDRFLSVCLPRLRELFQYWDQRRRGRTMPRRADIDPVDFPLHLPRILLVDVEGEDDAGIGCYRYRVVGTKEAEVRGRDPTGLTVREAFFGPSLDDVLDCYETVRRQGTYLYDPKPYRTKDGRWSNDHTLFLPLSEDGLTVSQVLVYAERAEDDR